MSAAIRLFIDICLLRKGPEDVPHSGFLLGLVLLLSVIVSVWVGAMINSMQIAVFSTIAELFFTYVFVKLLLLNKAERFLQTFIALLGTLTLINISYVPAVYIYLLEGTNENIQAIIGMLAVVLLIWKIAVCGHIFSKALPSPMVYGVAISIAYALMNYILVGFSSVGTVAT